MEGANTKQTAQDFNSTGPIQGSVLVNTSMGEAEFQFHRSNSRFLDREDFVRGIEISIPQVQFKALLYVVLSFSNCISIPQVQFKAGLQGGGQDSLLDFNSTGPIQGTL